MIPTAGPILLIAPVPPPYGGMALQAQLLASFLRRDGVTVLSLPANFALPRWLGPLRNTPGIRTLLRAVLIWVELWRRMAQVDIVHVLAASWLYFFLVVCPAIVVGRIRRKHVVLNYRGGGAKEFFDRLGWAVRPFFRAASVVTAPSEFLANLIRRYFQVPVEIVPNIVDLSRFRFRHRIRIEPKLLVTRHLEKMYDVESVVKAFQLVQAEHPEAALSIAGTGGEEDNLRSMVAALNLRNVRFLGHVPHAELPGVLDQCDILVNGSRVDNFPGALLEASAAGLPVVSTAAGGIPVIYKHRKNALLTQPGDWRALAAAVEELLAAPSLTGKLSVEGSTVAHQCDWAAVSEALYRVYATAPQHGPARLESLV
jgi:glycosyltransferase involved in cell wall biosynthesis